MTQNELEFVKIEKCSNKTKATVTNQQVSERNNN